VSIIFSKDKNSGPKKARSSKNVEVPALDSLEVEVDIGDGPDAMRVLESLLGDVVEAGGGGAGVLVTSMDGRPRTSTYGFGLEEEQVLKPLMEAAVKELTDAGEYDSEMVLRLRQQSGASSALGIPVRVGGRSIGMFCLLHNKDDDKLLDDASGIYHLMADKVEVTIQNARLLKRLLTERKWLEAVVQHSSDGVVILDRDGLVVGYNLTMSKLSGWSIGEAVGRPSHEVFPLRLEARPEVSTSLVRVGRRFFGERTEPMEAQMASREGEVLDVEVSGAPLFDEDNKPLGWVMMLRDISRRKEMAKLQKVFLSAVSHELHTPIAIIKGFAGLMADPEIDLPRETIRDKAAIIIEESQRLEKMVKQMLEATRIQAGGLKPQLTTEDVSRLVTRAVEKIQPVAEAAGCQVSASVEPDHFLAMVDGSRLQQVVINLLENATKYSKQGKIEVVGTFSDRFLTIAVGDDGPGVPAEERERLFEPFVRGKTSAHASGSGLGLYIAKAIVEAHGGTLSLTDSGSGGAKFVIRIPTRKKEEC
jgi:PAS domain S-box-containing protein